MGLTLRSVASDEPVDATALRFDHRGSELVLGEGPVSSGDEGLPLEDRSVERVVWRVPSARFDRPAMTAWFREARRVLRSPGELELDPSDCGIDPELLTAVAADVGLCPPVRSEDGSVRLEHRRPPQLARRPLVSILIAAHRPDFLDMALTSARFQTYGEVEILVAVDGGDTGAKRILARHAALDGRVVDVGPPPRRGGRQNYLHLLANARGPYAKFLNDDDVLLPEAVERMASTLMTHPDVTLVTSHRRLIDATGRALQPIAATRHRVAYDAIVPGPAAAADLVRHQVNWVGEPSTTMFRIADLRGDYPFQVGRARARTNVDFALWLQLLARGDLAYLTTTLSEFRRHGQQQSNDPDFLAIARQSMADIGAEAARIGLTGKVGTRWRADSLDVKPWWSPEARALVEELGVDSGHDELEALRWALADDRLHRLCVAQISLERRRPDLAITDLGEVGPDDLPALKLRAVAQLSLGRPQAAATDLRTVLQACPTDEDSAHLLARLG